MFKNANGRVVLQLMVTEIQANKTHLGDIDGLIGDGDHGMNMNKGFTMFGDRFLGEEISFTDGLESLGSVLFNEIGGSMGPIYGTIFMEMANKAEGNDEITLPLFSTMLDAGINGLYNIVDARVGDKTLVDTLVPASEALHTAMNAGGDFTQALFDMKEAAIRGRDSTKELAAKFGRSSRLGERSKGVLDAGAASCCIILCAMADGIIDIMTKLITR